MNGRGDPRWFVITVLCLIGMFAWNSGYGPKSRWLYFSTYALFIVFAFVSMELAFPSYA